MKAVKLTQAQESAAHGLVFDAVGVLNGHGRLRFLGVWPTGNVAVKPERDREDFGPLTVSQAKAAPLLRAIDARFPRQEPNT